jgi:hypothetical protein
VLYTKIEKKKLKMEEHVRVILIAIIIVFLLGLAFGIYYFLIYEKPEEPIFKPEKIVDEKAQKSEKKILEEKEEILLNLKGLNLDNSDGKIREIAQKLSYHPLFISWLKTDDLIRKFTAIVDNIADGESPRPHLEFLIPKESFKVIKKNGKLYIDPQSYIRYDRIADVFSSLNTKVCVQLYKQLKPLIQQAYRELGYPDKDFDETLKTAILELLNTPIVEGEIQLKEKVLTYKMVDPKLEKLSNAQKHLLRMGTQNVLLIQNKLREIASALGISEKELPEPNIYSPEN